MLRAFFALFKASLRRIGRTSGALIGQAAELLPGESEG